MASAPSSDCPSSTPSLPCHDANWASTGADRGDLLLVRSSLESGLSSPVVTDDSDEKKPDAAAQSSVEPELSEPQRVLPELGDAQRAFDVGNYTRVRELTEELLGDSNDEVRQAAQSLRRRVSVDPFQVGLLLACLAFFVYITWHYVF